MRLTARLPSLLPTAGLTPCRLGMVLWELLTARVPYDEPGVTTMDVGALVLEGRRPPMPPGAPEEYVKLVKSTWAARPDDRPTAAAVASELLLMRRRRRVNETLQRGAFLSASTACEVSEDQFREALYVTPDDAEKQRLSMDASSSLGLGTLDGLTTEPSPAKATPGTSARQRAAFAGHRRAASDSGSIDLMAGLRLGRLERSASPLSGQASRAESPI